MKMYKTLLNLLAILAALKKEARKIGKFSLQTFTPTIKQIHKSFQTRLSFKPFIKPKVAPTKPSFCPQWTEISNGWVMINKTLLFKMIIVARKPRKMKNLGYTILALRELRAHSMLREVSSLINSIGRLKLKDSFSTLKNWYSPMMKWRRLQQVNRWGKVGANQKKKKKDYNN